MVVAVSVLGYSLRGMPTLKAGVGKKNRGWRGGGGTLGDTFTADDASNK